MVLTSSVGTISVVCELIEVVWAFGRLPMTTDEEGRAWSLMELRLPIVEMFDGSEALM